jgi:ABC-type transport system substrate-binding protein
VYVLDESQPRVLAFEKGDIDYLDIPTDLVPNIMERDGRLLPRFAKAGVRNERGVQPSIVFAYFNMEDPVVGGYTKEKIALRRAIGMAYNAEEEIRVIRQGQGQFPNMMIPPNVSGYDPKLVANSKFDPEGAKALLDKFGYVDRDGDGWRDMPDGKPLVLKRGTSPSALERQYDELWARNMKDVGLRMEMVTRQWPEMLKMARNGQIQIWQLANTATSTDGYGVLGLLYGPNAGLANLPRFKLPEFDKLYDESKKLPDGADRDKLVREMSQIVAAYAPVKLTAYRIENITVYPWVIGFKYNPFNQNPWQYLDIDRSLPRQSAQ